MITITQGNLLYNSFDKILQFLINPFSSFFDFGCGTGQHTRNLHCKRKLYIDAIKTDDRPKPFIQMVEKEFWNHLVNTPDVIIALDFLEHLEKKEGYQFLIKALCNSELLILFCPEGDYLVQGATGYDQHQSGWTAAEMEELGFEVWLDINFHPSLNLGAFLAWRHKDYARFISVEDIHQLALEGRFK